MYSQNTLIDVKDNHQISSGKCIQPEYVFVLIIGIMMLNVVEDIILRGERCETLRKLCPPPPFF